MLTVDYVAIYNSLCDKYRDSIFPPREVVNSILESFYDEIGIDLYNDKKDKLSFTSMENADLSTKISGEIFSKGTKYFFSVVDRWEDKGKWQVVSWESEEHQNAYKLR
jgi:hypothetical protein